MSSHALNFCLANTCQWASGIPKRVYRHAVTVENAASCVSKYVAVDCEQNENAVLLAGRKRRWLFCRILAAAYSSSSISPRVSLFEASPRRLSLDGRRLSTSSKSHLGPYAIVSFPSVFSQMLSRHGAAEHSSSLLCPGHRFDPADGAATPPHIHCEATRLCRSSERL